MNSRSIRPLFALAIMAGLFGCNTAVAPVVVSIGVRAASYAAARNNPQLILPLEAMGTGLVAISGGETVDVIHQVITEQVLSKINDPILRITASDVLELALAGYGQAIADNISSTDAKALLSAIGKAVSEGAALAAMPMERKLGAEAPPPASQALKPSFTVSAGRHLFIVD